MRPMNKVITTVLLMVFLSVSLLASMELPLHKKRFSDRVLIVWIGDYMQQIATVALATEKGIVVIEASLIRAHDARIREAIEKIYSVKVLSVRTARRKGKPRRVRYKMGTTPDWKRAVVVLHSDHHIDLF